MVTFNLEIHLERQIAWSKATFGPGERTEGVLDHIRKECDEVAASPVVEEWIDIIILGFDGAWRSGYSPKEIIKALEAKQAKNEGRKWPDWRNQPTNKAIEHVKDDSL